MRSDLVTIAIQGDFGDPRPAVVIQSELFGEHPTVTVLPVTGTLVDAFINADHAPAHEYERTGETIAGDD